MLRPESLSLIIGVAGSGKSAMLSAAREAWEAGGYRVRGATLSAIAAQGLEQSSGIASRTIASLEHAWGQGFERLSSGDVLVIDEAGLVGSRQMARVLGEAANAGAKVVLVGDAQQLQAIEAGAPFRALVERHGAAELVEVWRQRAAWQREATAELATGRTGAALQRYAEAGAVKAHETHASARAALVERWARTARERMSIMMAATRDDAAALNLLAREQRRRAGELGADVTVTTSRGERAFAAGDIVMFLRNDPELGLRNGTVGRVERVSEGWLRAAVDGRQVGIDLKAYPHVDHGYAVTIHKAQGTTVDRAFVLATPSMDRHSAYVALSRHRDAVELHYGRDEFASVAQLARRLSRERLKDMTLDYRAAFGARRGIEDEPESGRLGGLQLAAIDAQPRAMPRELAPRADPLQVATTRYLAATREAEQMREKGLPVLPHQRRALEAARERLKALSPGAARRYEPAREKAERERDARDRDFGMEL